MGICSSIVFNFNFLDCYFAEEQSTLIEDLISFQVCLMNECMYVFTTGTLSYARDKTNYINSGYLINLLNLLKNIKCIK